MFALVFFSEMLQSMLPRPYESLDCGQTMTDLPSLQQSHLCLSVSWHWLIQWCDQQYMWKVILLILHQKHLHYPFWTCQSTVAMHIYHAVLKVLDGFLPLVHHSAPNWFTACWSSLVHRCSGHINTATILWLLIIQGWNCKTVIKCVYTSSQACNYQCCQ